MGDLGRHLLEGTSNCNYYSVLFFLTRHLFCVKCLKNIIIERNINKSIKKFDIISNFARCCSDAARKDERHQNKPSGTPVESKKEGRGGKNGPKAEVCLLYLHSFARKSPHHISVKKYFCSWSDKKNITSDLGFFFTLFLKP